MYSQLVNIIYQCTKQPHISLSAVTSDKSYQGMAGLFIFFLLILLTSEQSICYMATLCSGSSLLYFQWCKECKSLIDEGEPIRKSVSCYYCMLIACWTLLFLNYSVYSIWITSNTICRWWNWCDLASWKITESLTSVTNLVNHSKCWWLCRTWSKFI